MSADPSLTRREARLRRRRRPSVVGILGELLITGGVLVFLFLGWQLWLNDLIVEQEHQGQAVELGRAWADDGIEIPVGQPEEELGDPPPLSAPPEGEQFAAMYVPRFGPDYVRTISEGTSPALVLNTHGVGHYGETQLPGEIGNFALAAHRTTYGRPFHQIADLTVGDKIYIQTPEAYYTYVFRNLEYVKPDGVGVLDPVPQQSGVEATSRLLTMTSCNPMFSAAERIIAYAVFESWQPSSAGPPAEIAHLLAKKG